MLRKLLTKKKEFFFSHGIVVVGSVVYSGGSLVHPYGVAARGDLLYLSNQDNNAVTTFNVTSQSEVSNNFPSIGNARGVSVDPVSGNVFVASKDAGGVLSTRFFAIFLF